MFCFKILYAPVAFFVKVNVSVARSIFLVKPAVLHVKKTLDPAMSDAYVSEGLPFCPFGWMGSTADTFCRGLSEGSFALSRLKRSVKNCLISASVLYSLYPTTGCRPPPLPAHLSLNTASKD